MGQVKRPKRVEYLTSLLRTESGKLLKRQLRAPNWAGQERAINSTSHSTRAAHRPVPSHFYNHWMPCKPHSRKELILDRAEQHFADHGFQGASLSAIARDCQIGNPGLLHHFPSKEVLYRTVLEAQAHELMQRMDKGVQSEDLLQQRLQAFILLQIEWMQARPAGFKLITRELLDNSERIEQAHSRPLEIFLLQSVALIEEGQAAGLLRQDIAAVALLTIILGSLNYAQIVRPTFGRAFTDPPLKSNSHWMQRIAADVQLLISNSSFALKKA